MYLSQAHQLNRPLSHVGIYIGDGRFVHAPSGNGNVHISRLDHPCFSPRFKMGRSYFNECHALIGYAAPLRAPAILPTNRLRNYHPIDKSRDAIYRIAAFLNEVVSRSR